MTNDELAAILLKWPKGTTVNVGVDVNMSVDIEGVAADTAYDSVRAAFVPILTIEIPTPDISTVPPLRLVPQQTGGFGSTGIGVSLKLTSGACPEQYDAFLGDRQVGYLRLRHGRFRVDCPNCGDETVYVSDEVLGDGEFDDSERRKFLDIAVREIEGWLARQPG